jgi:hypothetical protein
MSYARCQEYVLCIDPVGAFESLSALGVSAYPHMKAANAKKYVKDLKERTRSNVQREHKQIDTSDMYHHLLRTLGNG